MTDAEALSVILAAATEALRRQMEAEPRLATAVHHLAQRLAEISAPAAGSPGPADVLAPSPGAPEATGVAAPEGASDPAEPDGTPPPELPRLSLGGAVPNEDYQSTLSALRTVPEAPGRTGAPRPEPLPPDLPDLPLIARRSRIKAEACRWAVEKRRRLADGANFLADLKGAEDDLLGRLKMLPNCYIGVLHRDTYLADDEPLERLACCFENVAAAADLLEDLAPSGSADDALRGAMSLFAAAQSALRIAVAEAYLTRDTDQDEAFRWLSIQTQHLRILIERHMRLDDPADPRDWPGLRERIAAAHDEVRRVADSARRRGRLFKLVHYHAKALATDSSFAPEHDWRRLLDGLQGLSESGLPPTDPRLREPLTPLVGTVPEGVPIPDGAGAILAAVDAYLDAAEADESEPDPSAREPTAEVRRAAALLRGRRAVLIGGEARRQHRERLERELGLAELCWIGTREHQSTAPFEPEIARPDTDLVIVIVGLSSHSFVWDTGEMCRKHGKIMVRLPKRGYNINQVAHQVLSQASEKLAALPTAEASRAG